MRYVRILTFCCVFLSVLCMSAFADDVDSLDPGSESISLLSISPNSESGSLKDLLLEFVGDYQPVVKDYTYQNQNGTTQHSISVTPDWSWICSCAVLVCFVFLTFKTIGCVFRDLL